MTYTVLSHTADTGIEAEAGSFAALLETIATGMFRLTAVVEDTRPSHLVIAEVSAEAPEDMLVDALSELLYRSEVDGTHFFDISVSEPAEGAVTVAARGVPHDDVELTGPPIKAVTYHDLLVEQTSTGWYGRVYFDV